jgi:hypothetical protein
MKFKCRLFYLKRVANEIDCPHLARDIRVKIALVTRPLLTPVARKLCRYEHGVFASGTCVHSLTLLRCFRIGSRRAIVITVINVCIP